MSSDQWDPNQAVRIRMTTAGAPCLGADHAKCSHVWSSRMTRKEAELEMASALWLAGPTWGGMAVASAAIVIWTGN